MSYTINPNAKNKWARNAENTMDLSLETDASSVYLDNGRTLEQEIGESSMVSNVATVDSAMSKVIDGTLDGAYESGVMYGKTMVNGLSNPKIQQGEEYITMVSPTHLIINHGENLSEKKINVNYDWFGGKMKDGADYTLDIWILKNTMHRKTDPKANIGKFNFNSYNNGFYSIPANTLGHITYEVTTSKTNTGGNPYIETFTSCEGELEIQIVIRQGKNLVPIEQHFEGICDVKMPILRNVGKNLIHVSKGYVPIAENRGITISRDEINQTVTLNGTSTINNNCFALAPIDNLKILKGETYTITAYLISGVASGNYSFRLNDKGWSNAISTIAGGSLTKTKTYAQDALYIESSVRIDTGATFENAVFKVQFEKNTVSTSHEPYKSNILHTSEEIVLRKVNGVCDTYNPLTREYLRRIGEIVLDGSESWGAGSLVGDTMRFTLNTQEYKMKASSDGLCDKIPYIKRNSEDVEHIRVDGNTPYGNFIVWIKTSRLSTSDTQGFKQWLSQNPITVQYELAEPITTIVESLTTPFAYENGHVILESGYEGQSLLPTLEYSTVVNKTGQIENVAKTIQRQEKQLTMLEQMLIQNIINLDYNNTLLTLKNEMEEML